MERSSEAKRGVMKHEEWQSRKSNETWRGATKHGEEQQSGGAKLAPFCRRVRSFFMKSPY